ncbi:MAG: FMN-binding protein [Pseudomonadota bacterium]
MAKRILRFSGWLAALMFVAAPPLYATVFYSKEEALKLAFPNADNVETRNFFLKPEDVQRIEGLAQSKLNSKLVTFHVGKSGDKLLGYAIIDAHTVRTKPEVLLVVLNSEGQVRKVQVLAFHEPEEYLPSQRWYQQFVGKVLTPDLQLKREIHAVSGATLSARAATASVRKTLALYQVLIAGK